jgi:hypothetical protein
MVQQSGVTEISLKFKWRLLLVANIKNIRFVCAETRERFEAGVATPFNGCWPTQLQDGQFLCYQGISMLIWYIYSSAGTTNASLP